MDLTSLVEVIDWQAISLFNEVSHKKIGSVLDSARTIVTPPNHIMFYEGDPARNIYVLMDGHVKLSRTTPKGDQVILRYVSPGEAFGVIAVLSDIDYPVTASTIKPSTLLSWDHISMVALMERQPQIALNAIQILSHRIREFQERIEELATERMERRIARALLRLANHSGKRVSEGVLIDLRITRQDLAELTGTSMYSVSRTLSRWDSAGILLLRKEEIIIRQPHTLVKTAEDLE